MANPSSTILVTGATGNIGSALLDALTAQGANVIAGTRTADAASAVPARAVDFRNPASLEAAFDGVDTVFLLFPLVPEKRDLARHAVAAARAAGVKHLVRSSGAGADASSIGSLARLQGEIDEIVFASGIPSTVVRPASFMQNWVNYYAGMIRSGTVYLPLGEARSTWIDVRDIAAADAAILLDPAPHAGKAYTITGPAAFSVADGLAEIAKTSGRQATYVAVSDEAAAQSMKATGSSDWTIDILQSLNRSIAAGETAHTTGDYEALTGRPARSFGEFARDYADVWR